MKSIILRIAATATLAALVVLVLAGATAPKPSGGSPDKLVILTTNDVKGKTSPCG